MARHIDPPAQRGFSGVRQSNEKYPWSVWTDGQWWEAEIGSDFACSINSFRAACHYHAKTHGMTVETVRTGEETLAFRFELV